jgi:hypothetical protein
VLRHRHFTAVMALTLLPAATAVAQTTQSQKAIEGVVTGRGTVCVQFLADGIGPVTLENAPRGIFRDGLRFRLTGDWATRSRCMQGRVFAVHTHTPLPDTDTK